MTLRISDPLSLLPSQSGLLDPPLREEAAQGSSGLDVEQRAITIGEPVPIVFCRRVSGIGGVLVSPGATEARYENDGTTNELTVSLMLVLSEGEVPALPLKDVFQRACRVGTWAQTYARRAGTWTPGNYITAVSGTQFWDCPYYCGTGGRYVNMTTLSYVNTHDDGDQTWNKQVHAFVRNGMKVTRILDDTEGSSNNVIDLALYLIRESSRFPEAMLDLPQMEAAANFCDTNGFYYNGIFQESINLEEWLETIGNDFLLRLGDRNGKRGFRPRLPINGDYTIKTTAVDWEYTFTEDHILPDGFEISYIPLAERKPICAQVLWRQQPDDDLGLIRTAEVRYDGEAADGPFEQYDLSSFCASENHAVKVGAYRISRRAHITHTLRIKVRPAVYNGTLALGDIVRVRLRRETAVDAVTYHDYLYEVERIERTASGVNVLDLMHFPIDSSGASIVAKEVASATGQGIVFATGRSDFSCDISGRRTDDTPLPDTGIDPTVDNDDEVLIPRTGTGVGGGGAGGSLPPEPPDNPEDPLDEPIPDLPAIEDDRASPTDPYTPGTTLTIPESLPCPGGQVCWYRRDKETGIRTLIKCGEIEEGGEFSLSITSDEIDYIIEAEGKCPDGEPFSLGEIASPVIPDTTQYTYVRWTGTYQQYGSEPVEFSSGWLSPGSNPSDYWTLQSGAGCASGTPVYIERWEAAGGVRAVGSPIGPIPWRASVKTTNISGLNVFAFSNLGGLGFNAKGNPCSGSASTGPRIGLVDGPLGSVNSITGKWQFSNDQSTIELEWDGDTASIDPVDPEP